MIEYNKDKLKLKVLKIFNHGQNIYYFNDDECLCVTDTKTALDLRILGVSQFDDETYIAKVSIHSGDLPADEHGFNILRFHKAIKLSKIGDSMDNVIQLYLKTMLEKGCKSEGVARFLTKIERPMFGRYPDNKNEKTFNYVNMEANVLCRDNNMEYIKEKGTMVIGITEYAPMNFKAEDGSWTGFDTEFAEAVCAKLGVKAEFFVLSDWDQKVNELNSKAIDVVWNGMTITDELKQSMSISDPYVVNAQVIVCKAENADKYNSLDAIKDAKIAVETGSAGEDCVV